MYCKSRNSLYVKLQYRFAVISGSPSKKGSWTLLMFNLKFVLRESKKLHILVDPKVNANILQITQYGYVKLQYRFAVIPGSPSKKNSWTLLMFTLKFINDYVNSSDIIIMLRCRNFFKVNIIAQHSMPCCELLLNMAWFGRWLTTGWPLIQCTS